MTPASPHVCAGRVLFMNNTTSPYSMMMPRTRAPYQGERRPRTRAPHRGGRRPLLRSVLILVGRSTRAQNRGWRRPRTRAPHQGGRRQCVGATDAKCWICTPDRAKVLRNEPLRTAPANGQSAGTGSPSARALADAGLEGLSTVSTRQGGTSCWSHFERVCHNVVRSPSTNYIVTQCSS